MSANIVVQIAALVRALPENVLRVKLALASTPWIAKTVSIALTRSVQLALLYRASVLPTARLDWSLHILFLRPLLIGALGVSFHQSKTKASVDLVGLLHQQLTLSPTTQSLPANFTSFLNNIWLHAKLLINTAAMVDGHIRHLLLLQVLAPSWAQNTHILVELPK